MTQVVTGVAGFIGSHLAERLLAEGEDVVGIDNFHPYYSPAVKRDNLGQVEDTAEESTGSFTFIEGSILDEDGLEKLPSDPETVFHEAAIAGVRSSIQQPVEYSRINVLGTATLLDALDPDMFIFASSSSVYGEVAVDELPVTEEREPDPIAPYALSKLQGEQLVEHFSEVYGMDTAILRYFSVYGPRQRPDEAFTKFIAKALKDEIIPIYGDGEQSRDFTHVSDIVNGTIQAAEYGDRVYNIGSQRRVTVNEMVDTLQAVMDEDVRSEHVEQPEGDVSHTHADISRAEEELGYAPETGFEEGAESCVQWCRRMVDKELL